MKLNGPEGGASSLESLAGALDDPKISFYFKKLDDLGDISRLYPTRYMDKTNVGMAKVGARPLSGIRGLYFTKGMWKVRFLDDDYDVITCLFRYSDRETLIKSYHIAHLFLQKVIEYKRQIHEDDGTILEKLEERQLVELDNRKSKDRAAMKPREGAGGSQTRPHSERRHDPKRPSYASSNDSEYLEAGESGRGKKRKSEKLSDSSTESSINVGIVKSPGSKKPRKLSNFEAKFLKYCDYSALEMIHHVIDKARESRLSEHGKTYCVKHRVGDVKSRELEAGLRAARGGGAFEEIQDLGLSRDELLKKTSLKEDMDESCAPGASALDCRSIANGKAQLDDEGMSYLAAYNFDYCFKRQ